MDVNRIDDKEESELLLVCAVRYCIGKQTYMPRVVIRRIKPMLPDLTPATLLIMRKDIKTAGDWGDEEVDKPGWMKFLADIEAELERRMRAN